MKHVFNYITLRISQKLETFFSEHYYLPFFFIYYTLKQAGHKPDFNPDSSHLFLLQRARCKRKEKWRRHAGVRKTSPGSAFRAERRSEARDMRCARQGWEGLTPRVGRALTNVCGSKVGTRKRTRRRREARKTPLRLHQTPSGIT